MARVLMGHWLPSCFLTPLLALCAGAGGVRAADNPFAAAEWIWAAPAAGQPAGLAPAGTVWFRSGVAVSEKARVRRGELLITADNGYTVYLNGRLVGERVDDPNSWNQPRRFDVAPLLVAGHNVVAIEAVNTAAGPAGLAARLAVELVDGQQAELVTNGSWKCTAVEPANWQQPDLNDQQWPAAVSVGAVGGKPWGPLMAANVLEPAGAGGAGMDAAAPADMVWPGAVVYVGDDCSLYRPPAATGNAADSLSVTVFSARDSRAFPEHDLPSPMKVGRQLYVLSPAAPGATPRLLFDAGKGALGSPTVSYDGRSIYFSMAAAGDAFYHIYRLGSEGGRPVRLTDGPFHDIDPCELPDGRIAFVSTRIGTFEEYHCTPSRALFTMDSNGDGIVPLTHTIIFDNEPEVMADGRILLLRSDNFFGRGKVETMLHAIHPDGTAGVTEFGLDLGPEYGSRLRAFHCGSQAPMPDGRVAFLTQSGIAVGRPGATPEQLRHLPVSAGDVAALPDGRLLCTLPGRLRPNSNAAGGGTTPATSYTRLAVVDPNENPPRPLVVLDSRSLRLHSPVFLGERPRPPVLTTKTSNAKPPAAGQATGVFVCQNVRFTKNTSAGWPQVRAVRVLAGGGLTMRSSHSYIVHAGNEVTELGTVPLAADGSFAVEVPADTPIAFQAVDGEGRSELNEMSWIFVRPGETRSCVGCHQPRQVAPPVPLHGVAALRVPPLKLLGKGSPHRFRGNNAAVTGLMELQFDRYREVAGINRHSETAGVLDTGAQEVATLVARLADPSADMRISAAQRLAIFRQPAAAPALATLLGDPQREVRVAAALGLAACGTRDSLPPLLDALRDADPVAARAAVVALANLTATELPLDPLAAPDEQASQAAAWSNKLAPAGAASLENDWVRQLASGDRDQARMAAVALGHLGGAAGREALRAYVVRERGNNPFPQWRQSHAGDEARFNAGDAVNPRTLQAVVRALGQAGDQESVPLLAETLRQHLDPRSANLFLAESAVEALGRIGTPEALAVLIDVFAKLPDYPQHNRWYGDHDALIACHAAPVHAWIIEALDANGATATAAIVPQLIESVPTDTDRALLAGNDDYETLVGRVIRRSGQEPIVTTTCLAILGDPAAKADPAVAKAIGTTQPAWGGKPGPQNRAAQILSLVCRDRTLEPRVRSLLEHYSALPVTIPRVFDKGIPVVLELPQRHWVSFFLARTLGNLADPRSVEPLISMLEKSPAEAAAGRPDPLGPGVLFLHNDLTPCWRAEVAWALGRIADSRAEPVLLACLANFDNAVDTRHAAAVAVSRLATAAGKKKLRQLALTYPEVSVRRALLAF